MALLGKRHKDKPSDDTKNKAGNTSAKKKGKTIICRNGLVHKLLPIAGICVLLQIAVFAVVAWLTVLQPQQDNLQARTRHELQFAVTQIQLELTDMHKRAVTISQHPAVISALKQTPGSQQITSTENLLKPLWPENALMRIFSSDVSSVSPEGIGFSSLELVRKVLKGDRPMPVAAQNGNQWQILIASPVKSDDTIIGAVLTSYSPQRLQQAFSGSALHGFVQVYQSEQAAGKPVANIGTVIAKTEQTRQQLLPASGWSVAYTPKQSAAVEAPLWPLLAALLISLASAAGFTLYALKISSRRSEADLMLLERIIQDVEEGRKLQPGGFRQPHFQKLATTIVQLFSAQRQKPGQSQINRKPVTPDSSTDMIVTETVDEPAETATPEPESQPAVTEPQADEPLPNTDEPAEEPSSPETETSQPLFNDLDETFLNDLDSVAPDTDNSQPAFDPANVPAHVFRAYDIRGQAGEDTSQYLTPELAQQIGMAIGSEALAQGETSIAVANDGRLSSPVLRESLIQGLLATGIHVVSIGLVPTPVLYFATHTLKTRSGVMITGSHNPKDHNGFKIVIAGETLAENAIQSLYQRILKQDFQRGEGQLTSRDISADYQKTIIDDVILQSDLKVVIDCGNGAAGKIAPELIRELGCDIVPLYCDIDGNFPNHHPDPGNPDNLNALIQKVKDEQADLGIAFDGDGDRIGLVTNTGTIIYPDRMLMLLAQDVISRNPGTDIIFDVKSTRRLSRIISSCGGRPVIWKSGHSLIKKKMQETGALLAGEMSGHIFFKERWFGFDDGLYSASRLLEILSAESRSAEEVFAAFPQTIATPEILVPVPEQDKHSLVKTLHKKGTFPNGSVTDIDGMRVDYARGWGLVRASNTMPALTLRFEGDTQADLDEIQSIFKAQLNTIAPGLPLPF